MSDIERIRDCDVSPRYCYGELRLSRLNLYAPLLLHKSHFDQMYGDYFTRLCGPVLFVFAALSIMLNCMQIGLLTEQMLTKNWVAFWSVSRWFSVVCFIGTVLVLACFALLWAWKVLDEWIFVLRARMEKKHEWRTQSKC